MSTDIPGQLVKGVFQRVLAEDLTTELVHALASAGVNLTEPLAESYPRPVWYRAIEVTAEGLYSNRPAEERQRRLGRHLITALESRRLLKGPWLSMAKLMGPRRAITQGAEMGGRFSPVRLEVRERGARELELVVGEDQQPEFLAGLLEGLIEVLGGKGPTVRIEAVGEGSAVMSASWR